MSSAPVAVNWLTYEEHIRLADKLFRLHRTLRSLYRERSEAPLPTALKQAAELVGALQAGLNSDSLRHGAFPLLCTDSSTDLSDQLVEDALEIDRLVEAKPPCHCIISTAHKLLIAVTRVQLLLCSNKATPPFLLGVPRTPPPRAKAFPHRAEYQRVAEYLAALNVHLEVLEQAPGLPRRVDAEGMPKEIVEALRYQKGVPISFRAALESSTLDDLAWGQLLVLALYFAVQQQCTLGHYELDIGRMDQIRRDLQGRSEVDPEAAAFEALVPIARTIQTILAGCSTCACISSAVREMVEAMEAIRSLAPQPKAN